MRMVTTMTTNKKKEYKLVSQNKKAYHEFFVEETIQAGIELVGTEVKSLRQGKCNLRDSYVSIYQGEAYLINMHISPYDHGNIFNRDPLRRRKLLLHKKEINYLLGKTTKDSYTIVATKIYFTGRHAKVDIALAKGKKLHDKRNAIAEKDMKREAARDYKVSVRG